MKRESPGMHFFDCNVHLEVLTLCFLDSGKLQHKSNSQLFEVDVTGDAEGMLAQLLLDFVMY